MNSSIISVRWTAIGRVQGVGYRFFTAQSGRKLGLKGAARNCLNGTVEIVVTGERELVKEMYRKLLIGPAHSHVTQIDQTIINIDPVDFSSYDIEF